MVRVKICGIRRFEDVEYVNSYRPDYIGFIFAKSKRQIDADLARDLSERLDDGIETVGVFVNEDIYSLIETAEKASLDVIQLHGDEDEDYIASIPDGYRIWKAVRVRDGKDMDRAVLYGKLEKVEMVLLDAYSEEEYGGLGEVFDWSLIESSGLGDYMLAGGLNPENVQDAILKARPYGLDVSSGVESDGYKDIKKISEFIEKARN